MCNKWHFTVSFKRDACHFPSKVSNVFTTFISKTFHFSVCLILEMLIGLSHNFFSTFITGITHGSIHHIRNKAEEISMQTSHQFKSPVFLQQYKLWTKSLSEATDVLASSSRDFKKKAKDRKELTEKRNEFHTTAKTCDSPSSCNIQQ